MSDIASKIDSPVKFAALAVFLFFLLVKYMIKAKVGLFGEKASIIITMFSTTVFSGLLLLGLTLVFAHDYFKEYLAKTGKSPLPFQININKISPFDDHQKTNPNISFTQQILPEKRQSKNYVDFSNLIDIEEDKLYYNNDSGLEFTAYNINVENGTAQIGIGPSNVSAHSLTLLKEGGISYKRDGKICTIYMVNAHTVGSTKYITLQLQQ